MRKVLSGILAGVAATVLALIPAGADALSADAQAGKVVHFTSPSGNIDCFLSSDKEFGRFAQCFVQDDNWKRHKAKPASCDLDWSPTEVSVSRGGKVRVGACRGDVGPLCYPGDKIFPCSTLGYGESVKAGKIRCTSTRRGITCRTTDGDHHGFRVARSGLKTF
jgi:hypothetical protein